MKNLTILIVDDDPVIRRLLQQRLAREHHQVSTAENGQVAESLLEQHYYDVVLTDLMMPNSLDGIAVLELVKQRHPKTEVVLITAHSSVDSAVEAMKKGATDYLEKPINFDELFLRLDKIANLQTILKSAQDLEQAMTVTENTASQTIQHQELDIAKKQVLLEQVEKILRDTRLSKHQRIDQALETLSVI